MVTKGEGCGKVGREGGRWGLKGIIFSTHGVERSWQRQCSTEKTSSDFVASYYTDEQ